MGKMFYNLEEAKGILNKDEFQISQLVKEGSLREFRDGPRKMFKADQINDILANLSSNIAVKVENTIKKDIENATISMCKYYNMRHAYHSESPFIRLSKELTALLNNPQIQTSGDNYVAWKIIIEAIRETLR